MINNHLVYIIAAVDEKNGLGKNQSLPWHLSKEMKHFTDTTMQSGAPHVDNAVIMGQNTWESIPEKFQPLPFRNNIVLTLDPQFHTQKAFVAHSIDEALDHAATTSDQIFIIGGAGVYAQMVNHPSVDGIYLTRIQHDFNCDVFFPEIPPSFKIKQKIGNASEKGIDFAFYLYKKHI